MTGRSKQNNLKQSRYIMKRFLKERHEGGTGRDGVVLYKKEDK